MANHENWVKHLNNIKTDVHSVLSSSSKESTIERPITAHPIVIFDIDALKKQNYTRMNQQWNESGIHGKLHQGIRELGLDNLSGNALLRNAWPKEGKRFPLTVAGLRLFHQLHIPIDAPLIGNRIRKSIADALERTSFEANGVIYPTTKLETDQMAENGAIEKL